MDRLCHIGDHVLYGLNDRAPASQFTSASLSGVIVSETRQNGAFSGNLRLPYLEPLGKWEDAETSEGQGAVSKSAGAVTLL